ncbi:energy transducer TonB [Pinirhizobacter soli]|uniref:energy transducer TonB n=1 Tax=Pinirhizobacter soli TaxID=2786953 RepID=UPI00202A84CC|nr:energy transducer TonB [Pinirhizobacter soli]
MSSAAIASRPAFAFHPDAVRIVALSASIALNIAALIAVIRPMAPDFVQTIKRVAEPIIVTWISPPPEVKPVPVIDIPPPPAHHTVTRSVPTPAPTAIEETNVNAVPVTAAPATPSTPVEAAPSGPVEATLAYMQAPAPMYPSAARRMHMQGTVVLRVLVDIDGKPLQVLVESSSGHAELDRAAQNQVLSKWRFQPATAQGRPTQAWARIPVTFNLQGG